MNDDRNKEEDKKNGFIKVARELKCIEEGNRENCFGVVHDDRQNEEDWMY